MHAWCVCFGPFETLNSVVVPPYQRIVQVRQKVTQAAEMKELRCASYLTYLINSCQGVPHSGVLTSHSALFIHGLGKRKARLQANPRSALCSKLHCLHLSHWLYTAYITGCQKGTMPAACQAGPLHA